MTREEQQRFDTFKNEILPKKLYHVMKDDKHDSGAPLQEVIVIQALAESPEMLKLKPLSWWLEKYLMDVQPIFFIYERELKSKFSKEFWEEYQFDALFRNIFNSIINGCNPYTVIEQLCISQKDIQKHMKEIIENKPSHIIIPKPNEEV